MSELLVGNNEEVSLFSRLDYQPLFKGGSSDDALLTRCLKVGSHEGISPCKERDKKKAAQNPGGEDRVSSPRLDFARPFYSQFSFDSPKTDVKWSTRGVMIIMLRECLNCLWKTMKKSLCFLGSITSRCSFRRKEKWSDLLPFNQVRVNRLMMPF